MAHGGGCGVGNGGRGLLASRVCPRVGTLGDRCHRATAHYLGSERQAIQHSTGGSVQMLDRGVRTEVMLTSKDLRTGSISYARQSGDVELRLVVYQPGRSAVEEMMGSSSLKKRARHPHHRWRPLTQNRRSEEHTSELQSLRHLVCRLLLEKKTKKTENYTCSDTNTRRSDSSVARSHA